MNTIFRFPKDPDIKKEWIDATGRDDWSPTKNSVICSRHFSTDCFFNRKSRRFLLPSAVPTLFLQKSLESPIPEDLPPTAQPLPSISDTPSVREGVQLKNGKESNPIPAEGPFPGIPNEQSLPPTAQPLPSLPSISDTPSVREGVQLKNGKEMELRMQVANECNDEELREMREPVDANNMNEPADVVARCRVTAIEESYCGNDDFRCDNGKCIEGARRCDRVVDCPSGEDELACATSSSHEEPRVGSNGEEDLWGLWGRLVTNWETEWRRRNQFVRDLVRQGVPHHFRGIVWQLLAGVDSSPEKKLYASYIKAQSACEQVIRQDIARTYPNHDLFKEKNGLGQKSLFNVMKAYSLHDREVGYCQGSGYIAGLLLMQMPEEEAFAVLVKIMQQHRMRDMFKPSMAELGLCMLQLENLVQELLPDLYMHFQSQSFSTSMYACSWFLTLFTTTLSLPLACRVMDVFLSEGIEIVFKVALAMLTLGKDDMLSLDMENILKYIQKELPAKADADECAFLNLAYSMKVQKRIMKKLEQEYTAVKTKEQGDIAELRCLRQENQLLKQRVELLEKESSALAERLVRGQVDRAEGAEETFALARELQALRREHVAVQQRLALAQDEIRSLEMTLDEKNSRQTNEDTQADAKAEELVRCLQRELVRARLHAAEREAAERELTARITELESENKMLRKQRDDNVAHLQLEPRTPRERVVKIMIPSPLLLRHPNIPKGFYSKQTKYYAKG
ncbi:unnamed protein product [Colias eurytheme]|nr:unnamed protein product [Colias eurytheme]